MNKDINLQQGFYIAILSAFIISLGDTLITSFLDMIGLNLEIAFKYFFSVFLLIILITIFVWSPRTFGLISKKNHYEKYKYYVIWLFIFIFLLYFLVFFIWFYRSGGLPGLTEMLN